MKISRLILFSIILFLAQLSAQSKRAITVDDLWSMKRIGNLQISPDGKLLAFTVTSYDMVNNSGQSDIWTMNSDGSNEKVFIDDEVSVTAPKFSPDGKSLFYSKGGQIWKCNLDGTKHSQVTDIYTGVSGLVFDNSGYGFLFTSEVYPDCSDQRCNKQKDKESEASKLDAMIFTELLYRHWDSWRGDKRSHLFFYNLENNDYTDLTLYSKFDVPTFALGSGNDYSFSPDGREIAFVMNNDNFLATSTNNDIFILNLEEADKVAATPFKKISLSLGSDTQPVYSPDGKYIAYTSMECAGFEADKQRLVLYDRNTKETKVLTKDLDISFGQIVWSKDSKSIYYTAANEIYNSIYNFNIASGENNLIVKERVNSSLVLSPDGNKLYFLQQRTTQPNEIFSVNTDGSNLKQLSSLNAELLSQIEFNEPETFWSIGAEGVKVQSLLIKPPFFDPAKKYPMIFLIHGGPQGHWTDDFHYRWNQQMFASQGYIVVAPNPRGSTGYGQKFTDEITQDWGGKVYTDLMNSYDHAIESFNFIDKQNTFAAGASYGGYMIAWIAGHTDKFNALVCHDGVYDLTSMYGSTEEVWFPEWEFGGAPWENPEHYKYFSPSTYAANFKTPVLVIQGGKDFRVPETQAFQFFTALQKMNVESKFLYFPNENHFVLKPQNAKLWWNTVYDWFNNYMRN